MTDSTTTTWVPEGQRQRRWVRVAAHWRGATWTAAHWRDCSGTARPHWRNV